MGAVPRRIWGDVNRRLVMADANMCVATGVQRNVVSMTSEKLKQSEFNGVFAADFFHVHAAAVSEWRERISQRILVSARAVA